MTNDKNSIAELLLEASEFNANDLLVSLNFEQCFSIHEDFLIPYDKVRKIIVKSQNLIKESGVNPLCLAKGSIRWQRNGTIIQSPLLLFPTSFKHNKVTGLVELNVHEEDVLLNPFVEKQLKSMYGISENAPTSSPEIFEFLRRHGFENLDSTISELGNFHHHRYELLKELEELSKLENYPVSLQEILGFHEEKTTRKTVLSSLELLAADDDHRAAFSAFEDRNLVVQGPPGTGKSQFLTNFIGKSLLSQKSIIVVSEKRSALEVITAKLKEVKLDHLSFISTPDLSTKDFLQSLKKSWTFFEEFAPNKKNILSTKKELEDHLQMTLNLLRQEQLIGGISYTQFKRLTENHDLTNLKFQHRVPDLRLVQEQLALLQKIYSFQLHEVIGNIQFSIVGNNNWNQLAENLAEMLNFSKELYTRFGIETYADISKLMQQLVVCQLFENTLVEKHSRILQPNSKEQKQFLKIVKSYQSLAKKASTRNQSSWKTIPSMLEIEVIIDQLNGNFWAKRKAKKRWNELSHLPINKALEALAELKSSLELEAKINEKEIQLHELGLVDISQEIPQILNAIPLFTEDKWHDYALLSAENKKVLLGIQPKLERFRVMIKHYFSFDDELSLNNYFTELQKNLHHIIEVSGLLNQLNSDVLFSLKNNSTLNEFMINVCGSHWSNFKKNYPILSQFEMCDLGEKINEILLAEDVEQQLVVAQINGLVSKKFKLFHQLLSTPATKLSANEKELKSRLRKGKSLLVKEFSKTKSHPSLRELFSSDAREWIQLLIPIWLSNPSQLAKCFPLEKDLFEHCVFDEASQILLQNGVGAFYRSKRIIIAGDDQQMGPTSYFKTNSEESISLLQQANHYLQRVMLQHHYRSQHPALIAFSNAHFYNNELTVFPSFGAMENCIQLHKVKDGKFIQRQNIEEAKKVATLVSEALQTSKSIGIVAFSKEQINCIWNALSEVNKIRLEEKFENNEAFLKPLEKVQGDECEHLIISMAYGNSEDGEFSLRMGPLNRTTGRNRLNVLFSRASKKIDFVCSVDASDFKLSENESINLLRNWLRYCAETTQVNTAQFPFSLHPKIEQNILTFSSIQDTISSANELVTTHRVLSNRGWEINYI